MLRFNQKMTEFFSSLLPEIPVNLQQVHAFFRGFFYMFSGDFFTHFFIDFCIYFLLIFSCIFILFFHTFFILFFTGNFIEILRNLST